MESRKPSGINPSFFLFPFLLTLVFGASFGQAKPIVLPVFPEEDETLAYDEFLIVALIQEADSAKVDWEKGVQVMLDDTTLEIERVEGTIQYVPSDPVFTKKDAGSQHAIKVVLKDTAGADLQSHEWRFNIQKVIEEALPKAEKKKRRNQHGRIFADARQNRLTGASGFDLYSGAYLKGSQGKIHYGANLLLTNLEDERTQARNFYQVSAGYDKIIQAKIGDARPRWDNLVLTGQRIRGIEINAGLHLSSGFNPANLEVAYGVSQKAVAPYAVSGSNGFFPGTYKQRILAIRPNFNIGRIMKVGMTFLRGRDDTASIDRATAPSMVTASGDTVSAGLNTPQDNLVFGLDGTLLLFKRRLELFGDYGLSLVTKNTLGGPISLQDVDTSLVPFIGDPQSLSSTFIFNTSSTPLAASPIGLFNSSALNAGLRLHAPVLGNRNKLELKFEQKGSNYFSMGNPLLGPSRMGIRASDWIALLSNKIMVNLDYGIFMNNMELSGEKPTVNQMLGAGVRMHYSPNRPAVSLNFMRNTSANESSQYAFNNKINSVYGNVTSDYRLGEYAGQAQFFTNWSGFDNAWNTSAFQNDSLTQGSDTTINFSTALYGANITADHPAMPLTFELGARTNAGVSRFSRMIIGNLGVRYQLVPEKLRVNAGTRLRRTALHNAATSSNQADLGYGFRYTPLRSHQAVLSGKVTDATGERDIVHRLQYEWQF